MQETNTLSDSMTDYIQLKDYPGFNQWGIIMGNRPYVIVYDKNKKEYTASTKAMGGKTIYILDYGCGTQTIEEAKEAVTTYHRKVLS